MKTFTNTLIVIGVIAQLVAFAAFAEEKAGENNVEARLSKVEKDIADIKALLDQNPPPVNPPNQAPVACSSINLRTAQLNVKCRTSKGSVYERVSRDNFGEAWKGPDGLIWSDFVAHDTHNAGEICKNQGGTFPSRDDFKRGEVNGFREVLPNMKDRIFWSSSVAPYVHYFYYFDGNVGDFGYGFVDDYASVRCVGR